MTLKERYNGVINYFKTNVPVAETELQYSNPYELIVAVILSAQFTDKRINQVTPKLFRDYPNAEALASASSDTIFNYIRSVSYPNNKAKHLVNMANMLLNDFKGVKFRAYNAVTARMAELMGAIPTTVQQAEVPQAFATGVVDAMVTSAATGVDVKVWDFAKYYYDVRVINNKNIVLVSKRALDALDPTTRQAVLKAAANAELVPFAIAVPWAKIVAASGGPSAAA
jgi:hypothetical protein